MPIEARLDPNDALYVDAYHTNAGDIVEFDDLILNFGYNGTIGTVDFWPNGGSHRIKFSRYSRLFLNILYVNCKLTKN